MNIKKGEKYIIVFNINGNILTYDCLVISIDNNFIELKDKFSKIYNYNINQIISYKYKEETDDIHY